MIATRWATPVQWREALTQPEPHRVEDGCSPTLLVLAMESLARGHHKVATQRALKVQACGGSLPAVLLAQVHRTWDRLSPVERSRMRECAEAWAAMVRRMGG